MHGFIKTKIINSFQIIRIYLTSTICDIISIRERDFSFLVTENDKPVSYLNPEKQPSDNGPKTKGINLGTICDYKKIYTFKDTQYSGVFNRSHNEKIQE